MQAAFQVLSSNKILTLRLVPKAMWMSLSPCWLDP